MFAQSKLAAALLIYLVTPSLAHAQQDAGKFTRPSFDNATFDRFTKFAGKGGLGVEYMLPNSNLGLFAQASSYLYDADRNGFDKTQVDVLWTGGLSYRISY